MPKQAEKLGKIVLITGCSSGIGRATAARLASSGHRVVATARKKATLAELESLGCVALSLDVTREESMVAAVQAVEARFGRIDVLVNNAGYSQSGAVETVPLDAARRQFETNVFGMLRLAQLVLPGMRRRGSGRIVNLSSMGGKLTFPGFGVYHASKFAVEALSDVMRFELKGFGVAVVIIEPGFIKSHFGDAAVTSLAALGEHGSSEEPRAAYAGFNAVVARSSVEGYEKGPMAALSGSPEDVARVVEKAISARRPRARYTVAPSAKVLLGLRRWLSDPLWDAFVGTIVPEPVKTRGTVSDPKLLGTRG